VGVANLEVGGAPLVVFWAPGTVSALDSSTIANSRDVGTGVAYSAATDGTVFTFRAGAESGMFEDLETGSTWDITGLAIAGSLEGTSLEVARHANHFWFAFAAFYPGTEIWEPPL
jgi:hypothetical protein